jgi:hypothetical protein
MDLSPNRIVAFLTPLVFVPAAGWIAQWSAQHLPGVPNLDPAQLTGIFATGAVAALTMAFKWLQGWQQHEARQSQDGKNGKPAGNPRFELRGEVYGAQ